jgi:ankyrin repeat protein
MMSRMMQPRVLGLVLVAAVIALLPARGRAELMNFPEWYTLANAAQNGRNDEIAVMLRRGDNPNFVDPRGRTPLSYVAALGDVEGVKLLLNGGARVDYRDGGGSTALHAAAEHGRTEAIRALLQARAPADVANREGVTPLMLAAGANRPDAVRLLLEAGADPKKQDYTGRDAESWGRGKPNVLQALQTARAR